MNELNDDFLDDFLVANYDYFLPPELIAQSPAEPRSAAKLMVYNRALERVTHTDFGAFVELLKSQIPSDTLIILNNTKVIHARVYGRKLSGGKIEIFYHKELTPGQFLVQMRGRVRAGEVIILDSGVAVLVLELLENGMRIVEFYRAENLEKSYKDSKNLANDFVLDSKNLATYFVLDDKFFVKLNTAGVLKFLESHGEIPLPPYIKSDTPNAHATRYQSVFAKNLGAVAAPTASLHFDAETLKKLQATFETYFVTLHVGAGTFLGVEKSDLREHKIHSERYEIPHDTAAALESAFETKRKILCVGTTALRSVEHFYATRKLSGECDIFIHLGNPPKAVSMLLTNFHLPKTTLLMLVAAMLNSRQKALELYQKAIAQRYRFYSFGDGMLII